MTQKSLIKYNHEKMWIFTKILSFTYDRHSFDPQQNLLADTMSYLILLMIKVLLVFPFGDKAQVFVDRSQLYNLHKNKYKSN